MADLFSDPKEDYEKNVLRANNHDFCDWLAETTGLFITPQDPDFKQLKEEAWGDYIANLEFAVKAGRERDAERKK